MNTVANITPPQSEVSSRALASARMACQRIAPLWPLKHFVAANPFVGLTDKKFHEACQLMSRVVPGGMQMKQDYYRDKWQRGQIVKGDLHQALAQAAAEGAALGDEPGQAWTPERLVEALGAELPSTPEILSVAEALDRSHQTTWVADIVGALGQFCSSYYDQGQSAWQHPWKGSPLFQAWKETAQRDAAMTVLGWRSFRQQLAKVPAEMNEALAWAVNTLGVPETQLEDYLHTLLMEVRGWAGHVQYEVREKGMHGVQDDSLLHLLTIRLVYDALLLQSFASHSLSEFWPPSAEVSVGSQETWVKYVWQLADEAAWLRELSAKLAPRKAEHRQKPLRPAVQGVFCIDVRSEVFRRSLEATSPDIETLGFAGFFGLPIEYIPFGEHRGRSQCPVLLKPAFKVRETLKVASEEEKTHALRKVRLAKRASYAWNSFKTSAISCFSFVEAAGLAFGPKLWSDAFSLRLPGMRSSKVQGPQLSKDACASNSGIPLESQVQLALGALTGMGLRKNFARLVLLCGHGSDTTNNPYGSGLDCGACGGHAGDANARVAAAILNHPEVRQALKGHGIEIPEDTVFIAGLHHTTTDHVSLFDVEEVPASHQADLAQLQSWLEQAGRAARRERAPLLGLDGKQETLDREIELRSRDWSQVRPEWGLAGNAAFIAAPRSRTAGVSLGGRAFLHNYNSQEDVENRILESIMTAPMIVANWINLQYYASTANPAIYGSGTKVTHNVVGVLGVCQGNGGDLQTGLPLQSVHDGQKWVHEPLRLHVVLEAPRERIDDVLAKHAPVRQLLENGWLIVFAMEREGEQLFRWLPGGTWKPIIPAMTGGQTASAAGVLERKTPAEHHPQKECCLSTLC